MAPPEHPLGFTRREMLQRSGMGLGAMGLSAMLGREIGAAAPTATGSLNPLASKPSLFLARAKHIIHFFMNGGPSHVDTFDPKPALQKYAGQPVGQHLRTERETGAAFPSPFKFRKYGQSGIEVSELFPHIGEMIDDVCVIRSMHADLPNHEPSLMLMNCGDQRLVRPSVGAWVTYGLGTENENLPGFVVMVPKGYPIKGSENWRAAFLPGAHQGTYIDPQHQQIDKLIQDIRPAHGSLAGQRRMLGLAQRFNRRHLEDRRGDPKLEARIQSFELAYRMQMAATDAFDIGREPEHVHRMYGGGIHARQTLIARRLVERGVRYVQLWHGQGQPWDHHENIASGHRTLAGQCSQAIGALLKDLKQRGMLDETLVIWGGEFGRTPTVELPSPGRVKMATGRDHNHYGFTVWLAGGGVKGGTVHGATDEFGFQAVDKRVHVHDLHATILHLLGLDHEKLTYRYAGRDFRLTDVSGNVVHDIVA